MTKSKIWFRALLFLAATALILAAGLSWFQWSLLLELNDYRALDITHANFERIQRGMTENQVNQILGVPPGDYRAKQGFILVGPSHIRIEDGDDPTGGNLEIWYIPRFHVEVFYDRDGRVLGKFWFDEKATQ